MLELLDTAAHMSALAVFVPELAVMSCVSGLCQVGCVIGTAHWECCVCVV